MQKILIMVSIMGLGFILAYLPDKVSPPPTTVKIICWLIYGFIFFYM